MGDVKRKGMWYLAYTYIVHNIIIKNKTKDLFDNCFRKLFSIL